MPITQTFKIRGMHCASCSVIIEKTLKKEEGVHSIETNYGTETAKISFDDVKTNPKILSGKIEKLGYSLVIPESRSAAEMGMSEDEHAAHLGLSQTKNEKLAELSHMKWKVASIMPLAAIAIVVMAWDILTGLGRVPEMSVAIKNVFRYLLPVMATYSLFVVGQPYLLGFYRFMRYGKANMDTLIGLGTSVAYLYSIVVSIFGESIGAYVNTSYTYYDITVVVIAFITLGKYLEARSKIKTGDAIEKLLNMQAKTALVIRDGKEIEIPITEVIHGDFIIVKPAGKIPVDGVITEGESFVDESMISGEPMPVEKKPGDTIVAGTINTSGTFTFRATKVGSETMLANIIKMVEDAQGSKAPIQALADKISGVFVPIVLVIAFLSLGSWLFIGSQYLGFAGALSFGLASFVGVLVIACPCALGLATPTAIIVGVGKGAGEGILVKDAATLEKLHKVNVVVVDKTGTLTRGKPELTGIKNRSSKSEKEIISILASLENKSEHPIAHAVTEYAKQNNIELAAVSGFEIIKGKGLKGIVSGAEYFVGNIKMISDLNIVFDKAELEKETAQGKTPLILAGGGKVLGVFMVADAIKPEAIEAVKNLHRLGIRVVMLTGDDKNTALAIAKQVGIDDVVAEVMPEDKLKKIKALQAEGKIVAMAGDGVNDAPALAAADVGIAMATGTDVAIESAGITLLHGDVSKLVKAIALSKMTMRGIKQNLFWAFIYNIVGIPVAAGLLYPIWGVVLNPIFAGLAMAFSSVSVVGNSLRLKTKKL
ncbi:MAG: heavy metal translocating P-type ATPase [Candidatus Paceibacterota bacterium]|jgi:Cu2+-exporting ATPase/Cu+-exporting ATPase